MCSCEYPERCRLGYMITRPQINKYGLCEVAEYYDCIFHGPHSEIIEQQPEYDEKGELVMSSFRQPCRIGYQKPKS